MNKKDSKHKKSYILNVRLTKNENAMAKTLRGEFNINISGLIRNTIRMEYEKTK